MTCWGGKMYQNFHQSGQYSIGIPRERRRSSNFFLALHHQSHSHPRADHWIKLKSSRGNISAALQKNYSKLCLRMIGWKSSGINFSGRAFSEWNWPHSDQAHQQQFDRSQMHTNARVWHIHSLLLIACAWEMKNAAFLPPPCALKSTFLSLSLQWWDVVRMLHCKLLNSHLKDEHDWQLRYPDARAAIFLHWLEALESTYFSIKKDLSRSVNTYDEWP